MTALLAKIIEVETAIIVVLKQNPIGFGTMSFMDFEFYFDRAFKILTEQAEEAASALKNTKAGINRNSGLQSPPASFSLT